MCFHDVAFLPGGNAPCKILSLEQSFFYTSVEFHGDHKTVTKLR